MSAAEYRLRAAEFFRLATAATDMSQKAWLIEMAQAWLGLAEQAERNSAADLTYETPPRRDDARPQPQQQQQQQPQPEQPKTDDDD